MDDGTGLLTLIAAAWGVVFTVNSAVSAILQTKWILDQRNLLKRILEEVTKDDDKIEKAQDGPEPFAPYWCYNCHNPTHSCNCSSINREASWTHSCNLPACPICNTGE